MNRLFYFVTIVFLFVLFSCSDDTIINNFDNIENTVEQEARKIGLRKFSSKQEFAEFLRNRKPLSRFGIKEEFTDSLTVPIKTLPDSIIKSDPILARELWNIDTAYLIQNDNLTVYEAAGYDSIVPDMDLARVLNVRGEVQIADTVYKISNKGTYYFHVDKEAYFTTNYDNIIQEEGQIIGNNLYQIIDGIYLYDTFKDRGNTYFEENKRPIIIDDLGSDDTSSDTDIEVEIPTYDPSEIDWSIFPTYYTDNASGISWVWQKLFGCDKGYLYGLTENRRVKVKLYYYNYVFWASTGAYVVMQKKNWIGWSGTNAKKLYLQWKNIIFKSKYTVDVSSYPTASPAYTGTVYDIVPGFKYKGYISSYVGVKLTNTDVEKLKAMAAKHIFDYLKSKFSITPPSNTDVIMLYSDVEAITVIPNGYLIGQDEEKVEVKFAKAWGFKVTLDLLNLPLSWMNFAKCIDGNILDYPELLHGEVRGAACLEDGIWGGISLIKE